MKIAISAENKNGLDSPVSHHFGRCPCYVLVEMDEGGIVNAESIENPFFQQHQPGMVPNFINDQGVNVMISGGMGRKAIDFFQQFGIDVATGASGTVRSTLDSFISGGLRGVTPCKDHARGNCNH